MRFLVFFVAVFGVTSLRATPHWPEWARPLSPSARFQLSWNERFEEGRDRSTPELLLQLGAAPKFSEYFQLGIEVSTGGNDLGGSFDSVDLNGGLTSKPLSLRQIYLLSEFSQPLHIRLLAGKFLNPMTSSPLIWDADLAPEGFSETIDKNWSHSNLRVAFAANQWSLDQVQYSATGGTPQRRSWLFSEGLKTDISWADENHAALSLNHYFFYDMSENLATASSNFGNSLQGLTQFRHRYAPVEFIGELSGRPLGITTGVSAAIALNPRSSDHQRGFWAEGHIGSPWAYRHLFASLSYIYNEPDLSVAVFNERDYGGANRKAILGRLSYFIWSEWRVGSSLLWSNTLASSSKQNRRVEMKLETEFKF